MKGQPKTVPASRSRGACSSNTLTQLILLAAVGVVIFIMGIGVGMQYFGDQSGSRDVTRPWLAFTKQNGVRLPPGVIAGKKDDSIRLRKAQPAVEDEEEVYDSKEDEVEAEDVPRTAPTVAKEVAKTPTKSVSEDKTREGDADEEREEEGELLGVSEDAPLHAPELWSEFTGATRLTLNKPLDALEVSVGAWVYLDPEDKRATIKTILSNRDGGCAVDEAHRGWSFFVNNWESNDRALVLEWRDSSSSGSGCARLSSESNTVPYGKWTHVGFTFQAGKDGKESKALLFLDGKLLRVGTSRRKQVDVQISTGAVVGSTADGQYPWVGRVAYLYALKGVITPKQLGAVMKLTDAPGWASFAESAKTRLLGLLLLARDKQDDIGPATLGWAPTQGESDKDVFERMSSRTFRSSSALIVELSGKVDGSGMRKGLVVKKVAKAKVDGEEEEGEEGDESPPKEKMVGAPRKHYSDVSGEEKVPSSIGRDSIPGTAQKGAFDFTSGGNQWVPKMIRVPKSMASGDVTDAAALAAGTFSDDVTQEQLAASDAAGRIRADAIRNAMKHVWSNYEKHAYGMDELKPRSGRGDNNWAGVGMTLIDSLDTLWVMGMQEEFERAKEWVALSLNFNKHSALSVFETTIRALGGLLSAYDLSGEPVFLEKAKDLGDRLMPAFNTPTGIPRASITLASGAASNPSWTGGASILSELGTLQVEFRYLSHATGEPHYGAKAEAVITRMDSIHPNNGLYPIYISSDSGTPTTSTITFGALGDSFYEYLVKVWVQGGRSEAMYRRMYDAAMNGMTSQLLKRTHPSNLAYVADWDGGGTQDKMDHLVCFVPGMLALGAYTAGGTPGEGQAVRDLINAKALTYTCWQMYQRMATGIAPEFVEFPGGADLEASSRAPFYILRPEAAESLYILHQLTGNPVYREWGWKMFSAIEKYCKTEYGYGAHPDVRDTSRVPDDRMESFFLAETLKYLYMLQSPDHPISLDKYVFNTEAHPLSTWDSPRWKTLNK